MKALAHSLRWRWSYEQVEVAHLSDFPDRDMLRLEYSITSGIASGQIQL